MPLDLEFLDRLDSAIDGARGNTRLKRMARASGIRASEDFRRILTLPRREWGSSAPTLAQSLTEILSIDGSQIRPLQAVALYEMQTCRGLLGPIGVGEGKTLITLLAPTLLEAKRPLLLLPAKLIEKTRSDYERYKKMFRCVTLPEMLSYESLSRVNQVGYLDKYNPDLVLCDEVHKLKNRKAAVTRRVERYVKRMRKLGQPSMFVALSGTITNRSLHDFAHLSEWALWDKSPLPQKWTELNEWAMCIDHSINTFKNPAGRPAPGVLTELSGGDDSIEAVRQGVFTRIVQTPGVIASSSINESLGSLEITVETHTPPEEIEEALDCLRDEWLTPDDWPLTSALEINRIAQELALGFYYRWEPRPPTSWLDARRAWGTFVRTTISQSRHLDSELAVARAVDAGDLDCPELAVWRACRDSFKPNSVPVWFDDSSLMRARDWIDSDPNPCIVFCDQVAFGERLAELTGLPYCGREGKDANGIYIENYSGKSVIASLASNLEGRNLQAWSRALVPCPPSMGSEWEQLLGRLHRSGQTADTVEFTTWILCDENRKSWDEAQGKARYSSGTAPQKLLYADIILT